MYWIASAMRPMRADKKEIKYGLKLSSAASFTRRFLYENLF